MLISIVLNWLYLFIILRQVKVKILPYIEVKKYEQMSRDGVAWLHTLSHSGSSHHRYTKCIPPGLDRKWFSGRAGLRAGLARRHDASSTPLAGGSTETVTRLWATRLCFRVSPRAKKSENL